VRGGGERKKGGRSGAGLKWKSVVTRDRESLSPTVLLLPVVVVELGLFASLALKFSLSFVQNQRRSFLPAGYSFPNLASFSPRTAPRRKMLALLPLFLTSIFCLARAQTFPLLPNILAAFNGYDLIKSAPFGSPGQPVDPGMRRPVFAAQYTRNLSVSMNGHVYSVPDGIDPPTSKRACSYSSSHTSFTAISSAAEFQASMLQYSVGAGLNNPPLGISGAAFSGSAVFQSMWASVEDVVVSNFVTCSVFSAFMDTVEPPPLTSEFAGRVAALNFSSVADLFAFSRDFGTHYMDETVYGGVAYTYTHISEASYQAFNAQGFSFSTAAGLMFLSALGADVSKSSAYAAYQALNASSLDKTTQFFAAPIAPPAPTNVDAPDSSAWQSLIDVGSAVGPAIVGIPSLTPLVGLFQPRFFPNDPLITMKAAALIEYLTMQYCTDLNPTPGCTYETQNPIVAYFSTAHCPAGWTPYAPAGGRVIFAADGSPSFPAGITNGDAMANMAAPSHTHAYSDQFNLPLKSLEAARGGSFNILGAGTYNFYSPTSPGPGFPLFQLITCTNNNASSTPIAPIILPTNANVFFDSASGHCPQLTLPTSDTAGYTPVSGAVMLPSSPPLIVGSAITHAHVVTGQYQLPGGCTDFCTGGGDGGSGGGNPSTTTPLTSSAEALPYITMLMCALLARARAPPASLCLFRYSPA
jgi:MAC/Perforin domain